MRSRVAVFVPLAVMLVTAYAGQISDEVSGSSDNDLAALRASTFLGGSGFDAGFKSALDEDGNVFVPGQTATSDYPVTVGAFDTTYNGGSRDAMVSKVDDDLTTLAASTFLGGSSEDRAIAVAFDEHGNVFVAGRTFSSDFPTTSGAADTTFNGARDVFVAKFDRGLTTLLASTLLGGSGRDESMDIGLDEAGNVFVIGTTLSSNFPTTAGAFDRTRTGSWDAFVSKFDNDLTTLLASTLIGGTDAQLFPGAIVEFPWAMAIDEDGSVLVTGNTQASDYPTTAGAFDTTHNGGTSTPDLVGAFGLDIFVSRLSNDLKTLVASSFAGGSGNDIASDIVLDDDGNVFVKGSSSSSDYPTTSGAFDTTFNGIYDVVVSKMDGELTTLMASTFVGGSDIDEIQGPMALDQEGSVLIAGLTASSDYPTTSGAFDTTFNGGFSDTYVSTLSKDLTTLLASTFVGGSATEQPFLVASDRHGNVVVTDNTESPDYPTTAGAFDTSFNGVSDIAVFKLSPDLDS